MKAIAEFCYRRRWYVVGGWILLLVGLFPLSRAIGDEYRTEFELPDSESAQAIDLLILVPAAMELMGNANWWAPKWLLRYLPTIRVDTVERPVPERR